MKITVKDPVKISLLRVNPRTWHLYRLFLTAQRRDPKHKLPKRGQLKF